MKKKSNVCEVAGCPKTASYNYDGLGRRPRFCAAHKTPGMKDVVHRTCGENGCGRQARFGFKELKSGQGKLETKDDGTAQLYCSQHRLEGMVDIYERLRNCIDESGCSVRATYNFKGKKDRLYCARHKKSGMVNLCVKSCEEVDCTKRPVYNFPGNRAGLYCTSHKCDGMINVRVVLCEVQECFKIPTFNFSDLGRKVGRFCFSHKLPGMTQMYKSNYVPKRERSSASDGSSSKQPKQQRKCRRDFSGQLTNKKNYASKKKKSGISSSTTNKGKSVAQESGTSKSPSDWEMTKMGMQKHNSISSSSNHHPFSQKVLFSTPEQNGGDKETERIINCPETKQGSTQNQKQGLSGHGIITTTGDSANYSMSPLLADGSAILYV